MQKIESGPAFSFPRELRVLGEAIRVTDTNAAVLRPLLEPWLPDVPLGQPMFAVVVDGHAVSVCCSVRETAEAFEAGVETVPVHRRRGYAPRAVSAWAREVRAMGRRCFGPRSLVSAVVSCRIHLQEPGMTRRRVARRAIALLALIAVASVTPTITADSAPARSGMVAAPPRHAAVRVLLYHDMEGLAGQDDWRTYLFSHPEKYPEGQKMLAADLNAVIDGLFAGGATQVDVVDAHGSGNPDPDVRRDLLDTRAKQVIRDKPFDPYVDITAPDTYDAVAAVGMHAKTGSRGFASHTITLGMDVLIDGKSITESEIVAYSWGRVNVPVIFVSGDDRLRGDLSVMPWIQFVVTKTATSASTVVLRPVDSVHAEMREKAARAVRSIASAKVMKVSTPVRAGLHAVPPASLESLKGIPGITYADQTVTFTAPDFRAAYDGVIALVGAARASYSQVLSETVRKLPNGSTVMAEYSDALFMRWMDYESGRWRPPAPTAASRKAFHGDR